jgi:hypothetical protein
LSLALPGLGAALGACAPDGVGRHGDSARAGAQGTATGAGRDSLGLHNSNSRLDSAVLKDPGHGATSATGAATNAGSATFRRCRRSRPSERSA